MRSALGAILVLLLMAGCSRPDWNSPTPNYYLSGYQFPNYNPYPPGFGGPPNAQPGPASGRAAYGGSIHQGGRVASRETETETAEAEEGHHRHHPGMHHQHRVGRLSRDKVEGVANRLKDDIASAHEKGRDVSSADEHKRQGDRALQKGELETAMHHYHMAEHALRSASASSASSSKKSSSESTESETESSTEHATTPAAPPASGSAPAAGTAPGTNAPATGGTAPAAPSNP